MEIYIETSTLQLKFSMERGHTMGKKGLGRPNIKKNHFYGMYICDTLVAGSHRLDEKSLRHKFSEVNIYRMKGLQIGQKGLVRP